MSPTGADLEAVSAGERIDAEGHVVRGTPRILDGESGWEWIPDEPWTKGAHELIVAPLLEDRCGNGLARPLEEEGADTPAGDDEADAGDEPLRIPFSVPPPTHAQ